MTENYYLVQQLLPFYFTSPKNTEFFCKTISTGPDNMRIFFEKELYGWVKDDFYRQKMNDKNAIVPEEEKEWKYEETKSYKIFSDDKKWEVIFVLFPPDFANENLDSIEVAIATKKNEDGTIDVELYMLEIGKGFNGEFVTFVCGRNIDDWEKHLNYDTIPFDNKFMSSFMDKVFDILKENN